MNIYHPTILLGIIYLKPDLHDFVVKRENLDVDNPILDLRGRSVIKHELRALCQKVDELNYYDVNKRKYTRHIRFIPDYSMTKMSRIFLDGKATAHFNRFLFHLRNEIAHEYAEIALTVYQTPKIKSFQLFVEKYKIGNDEFDYEHLRRDVSRMNEARKRPAKQK